MTLEKFKTLLLSADPSATRYDGNRKGNYTIWREYGLKPLAGDNRHAERVMRIQVDRFTKVADDPIAAAILAALDASDEVAYTYLLDYEEDTRYIHHIYDCEVI